MKISKSAPAAAVLALFLAPLAHAAPHGIFWARGQGPAPAGISALRAPVTAGGNLLYYGGPVISNAKVYAVFWGDNVDPQTKLGIGPFFANILDSAYMDWLSEYNTSVKAVDGRQGTGQKIGRGSFAGTAQIAPANTGTDLTDDMIQRELESQVAAGRLPAPDDNSLYMIYFPAGINISIAGQRSCQAFCAYHEGFKSKSGAPIFYGIMPVCGGFGCGFGNPFDTLTFVSSHEAIEAVTDPFPTPGNSPAYPQAWNTSDGEEIADVCPNTSTVTGAITSSVSQLWDNATKACNPGPWTKSALLGKLLAGRLSQAKVYASLPAEPVW